MTYAGISQTASKDSVTCIPNKQLRKAIGLIEEGKVQKEELRLTKLKIAELDSSINVKNEIILEYLSAIRFNDTIIAAQKIVNKNLETTISNLNNQSRLERLKLGKEKDKKWSFLLLGLLLSIFLNIK